MDKIPTRPVFIASLVLALSITLILVSAENRRLSIDNKTLKASASALRAKLIRLSAKNRELSAVIERNTALVKSVEEQKKQLKETMDSVKKENEEIQYEMKKAEAQMNTALEEKTYLEDILIHKTREIESLKTRSAGSAPEGAPAAAVSADTSDIAAKIKQKEDEIRRLSEQNQALSEKMDRLYQVTTSKISEINVAKIALEETVTGAKDTIDDEWNTVNLGSISVDKSGAPDSKPAAKRSGPKTEGKVLAINEDHGFVVVDLGKVDNLSSGMGLQIVRGGKSIASLSVLEIRDVMTACNIKNLESGQKIQINDAVQIQK